MTHKRSTSFGLLDAGFAATAVLLAALIFACFYAGVFYEGRRVAQAAKAELQDMQQRSQRAQAWLRDARQASEEQLQQQIRTYQAQLQTDQGKANATHHTLAAGMRSGTVSVRIPIVPTSCAAHGVPAARVPGAGSATTHAQLEPAAAADLADIAHEGDAAIRQLNACIAQYNAVRSAFEQWRVTLNQAEVQHAQTR